MILPNGAKIAREDRESGRVYVVSGDPDVRDALPSVTTVMKALPAEALENWKLNVGVDELIEGVRNVFRDRYMSRPGTQPQDAKAFSSLYAQAREWARQGCSAEVIDSACRMLNAEQFVTPLADEQLGQMLRDAITSGLNENYDTFWVKS